MGQGATIRLDDPGQELRKDGVHRSSPKVSRPDQGRRTIGLETAGRWGHIGKLATIYPEPAQRGEAPMPDFCVIEVALKDITPRIWRRFMITTEATFVDLHEAIEDVCGWTNPQITPIDETLANKKGKELLYVYDFGDWWEHDLKVVDVVRDWPEDFGRKLLDGRRAFPPDDCGGIGGYEDCVVVALGKKKDPERLKWLQGWHPEKFDFKETERLFYQAMLLLRAHYKEI
jgi:hypothetical protein